MGIIKFILRKVLNLYLVSPETLNSVCVYIHIYIYTCPFLRGFPRCGLSKVFKMSSLLL